MLRFSENIRGEEVFRLHPEMFAQSKPFSASIFNGKGELFFKKIDGKWHESIMSVDRCFGIMRSKWRLLNI